MVADLKYLGGRRKKRNVHWYIYNRKIQEFIKVIFYDYEIKLCKKVNKQYKLILFIKYSENLGT